MSRIQYALMLVFTCAPALVANAHAASISTLYDMNRMLNEPHPLAANMGKPWLTPTPAAPAPVRAAPVPASTSRPLPAAPVAPPTAAETGYKWLSEFRLGALKHSVPISGNTSKETGMDANLEVLFGSPSWMDIIWSPRPHIGATFNASSNNTDYVYSGLTWDWQPWKWLFINASFGFAVHNGKLEDDATKPFEADAGRTRELGCRALFRESLEVGTTIADKHNLSLVWDHLSNGGFCGEQNEGLDNVGVRYGYRF